jgi:RHS repeat-associated protein
MSRKRIVGGRAWVFGSGLFILAACGSDAMDGVLGSDSDGPQPSADGSRVAGSGGSAGSSTGTGGAWGATSGGREGSASVAPTDEPATEGAGGASLADTGEDGEEPEVLELPQGWTPSSIGGDLLAWYSANGLTGGTTLQTWSDLSGNARHLTQNNAPNRPAVIANGWGTLPTVRFDGVRFMTTPAWSAAPIGTNAAYTVLAVVRSSADPNGAAAYFGVASWWSEWGDGVWASVRRTNGLMLADFQRLDDAIYTQLHTDNRDLGTGGHVIAWRFSPSAQTVTLTVDGGASVSAPQPPLGAITSMPLIVGAMSTLPTGLFQGDISELAIIKENGSEQINSQNIQYFREYAQNTWAGLPTTAPTNPCLKASGQPAPNGHRCNDGNPATFGDQCTSGSCAGTVPGPGSPNELGPSAWYRAGAPEVVITWGGVSTWFDRSPNRRDLLNGYTGRPALTSNWSTKPTVEFRGGHALKRNGWTGAPTGTEQAFTVLAVLRPEAASQTSGVVSWWHPNAYGQLAVRLKATGGSFPLNLYRHDDFAVVQESTGTTNVGTARHVVAWRYAGGGFTKLTVDGVTQTMQPSPVSSITPDDWLVMGAASGYPTGLFSGDISELAVIPRSISDAELRAFNTYANTEWGPFTLCTPNCANKPPYADDGCGGPCSVCDPNAPFDAPVPAFTGTMNADGLTFSADGLTAYISGVGTGGYDIFKATRTPTTAFGTPVPVAFNTASNERAPSLSADEKSLYFTAPSNSGDIARAFRTLITDPFTSVQTFTTPLNTLASNVSDQDPYWWGTDKLLFASERPSGAHRELYVTTLTGSTFSTPEKIAGVDINSPYEDFRPVLTGDGLTLFFASKRPGIGNDTGGDVWVAKRPPTTQPLNAQPSFDAAANLWTVNSSGNEFPVYVTPDGCTLYFASNEETGFGSSENYRLYQATRPAAPPAQVTVTLNVIGQGKVVSGTLNCGAGTPGACTISGPANTPFAVTATGGQATWIGSCTANGGQPSSDGIIVLAQNGVCNVTFATAPPSGVGGPCSASLLCAQGLQCTGGTCGCMPGAVGAQCRDQGEICTGDADCKSGLVCGTNNGACFGGARMERRCWPAQCTDGIDPEAGECGQASSPCGSVCGCAQPCNSSSTVNNCPAGEVCTPMLGRAIGILSLDACGPVGPNGPLCPSNDPALCGDDGKPCGRNCIPVPACANATPSNPGDGAGGLCPNVCPIGLKGCCTQDYECDDGGVCLIDPDGQRTCRPGGPNGCGNRPLKPPLCGTPNALCGPECPTCAQACLGRSCGEDPKCGVNCGTCTGEQWCDVAGQCQESPEDPSIGSVPDLPPAPAAGVGAVPGTFSVTDQGTAQYTIPIEVPPGRLGMSPSLALVYQATRDSGTLGVGWRIDGLSKITRCSKNFATDGQASGVKNDSSDALCLDGKRLLPIDNVNAPGGNGTVYRTLIDSFAKIVSRQESAVVQPDPRPGTDPLVNRAQQGPDVFEVRTKDGRIMTFGGTLDSLVIRPNGVRQAWLLRKIEDRVGNNILYTYENASQIILPLADGRVPVRLHPKVISYTGRGETPGNRRVVFDYETRTDPSLRFLQGGLAWTLTDRLKRVTTYVGANPVKNYALRYRTSDFTMIEGITECEGDRAPPLGCKAETTFSYNLTTGLNFIGPIDPLEQLPPGAQFDANGDGFPDFFDTTVYVETEGVSADPTLAAAAIATDIVIGIAANVALPEVGSLVSRVWSDLIGPAFWGLFAEEPEVKTTIEDLIRINPQVRHQSFTSVEPTSLPCHFANSFLDYDRDGRDDLLQNCARDQVNISLSTGNGQFVPGPTIAVPLGPAPTKRDGFAGTLIPTTRDHTVDANPIVYDIDGDSLQDIVSCRDECTIELRRRSSATGLFDPPIQHATCTIVSAGSDWALHGEAEPFCATELGTERTRFVKPPRTIATFDVDGDGTPELLQSVSRVGQGPEWRALRYVASGGAPRIEWQPVQFPNVGLASLGNRLQVADFNSDGLADVLNVNPGRNATIWLNTGGGAFLTKQLPHQKHDEFRLSRIAVADYNGDARNEWIEGWERKQHAGCAEDSKVAVLFPSSDQSAVNTTINPLDLQFVIRPDVCGGTPEPLRFDMTTDLDADGAIDVVSSYKPFYGSNTRTLLLSKVTDGLGNVTTIDYDAPGTYTTTCTGSTWPEACPKRMNGLVSRHEEGFAYPSIFVPQRVYEYKYSNARVNTTGHGWIGFDKRTIRAQGPDGIPIATDYAPETEFSGSVTTIEMEPVARYTLSGVQNATTPPYVYPFAGLPKKITVDSFKNQSPIESAAFRRRTITESTWNVGTSSAGLPFPKVDLRVTEVFEAPASSESWGLLTWCRETLQTDSYGNMTLQWEQCAGNVSTRTESFFSPNASAWLISNPELVLVKSVGSGGSEQMQSFDPAYDSSTGLLLSVTRASDTPSSATRTTTYARNALGNVESVTESASGASPRTTRITYEDDGIFPNTITNDLNHKTELHFDRRWGVPTTVADPNGIMVRNSYDGLGLLTETRDPQGITLHTYQPIDPAEVGELPGVTNSRPFGRGIQVNVYRQGIDGTPGGFVTTVLDSLGRPVRTRTAGFGVNYVEQQQRYDRGGRLAFSTLPYDPTTGTGVIPLTSYSYDGFNRLKRITRSDASVAHYHYASYYSVAPVGRPWFREIDCLDGELTDYGFGCAAEVVRTTDETGKQNVMLTDEASRIIRSIDGENIDSAARFSTYRYGAFGRLEEMAQNERSVRPNFANDDGPHTLFTYDPYGRRLTHTDPATGTTTYTYNGFDELKTSLDQKNQLRTFNYDILGRLQNIVDPAVGTTQWVYDIGANALGRLSNTFSPPTSEAPLGQHLVYTYEPPLAGAQNRGLLQRVDYILDSTPYPVSFTYDGLGNTKTISYPDLGSGAPIVAEYTYSNGFMTRVEEVGTGTKKPVWRMDSAFEGLFVEREVFGNSVATDYTYSLQRHFPETIKTTFGTSTLQDLGYTYYANGLIYDHFKNGAQRVHNYDALNRLSAMFDSGPNEWTQYAYDHLGNLTQRGSTPLTYGQSQPHHVSSVGNNTYLHDLKGNIIQRMGSDIPGSIQGIDYTPFDLPRVVTTGLDQGTKTTKFEYTANEERVVRRDTGPSLDRTRHFVTGLYQRLTDNIAGATLEERFRIYAGSREIAQIARENGVDTTLYFHADHLGTPETITTGDGGVSHVELDPWGAPTASTTTEVARVGFTGHEHDRDLGLIDMKGRVYDPVAARFTSADPIMQAPYWSQGLNRYAYVFNNPVNGTDPSGFEGEAAQAEWERVFAISPHPDGGATSVASSGGSALGSTVGMGTSVANTIDKAAKGGFPGQRSIPKSSRQSTHSGGTQAPTSAPPRGGPDAASANDGIEAPVQEGPPGTSLFDPERGAQACLGCIVKVGGDAARRYGPRIVDVARRMGTMDYWKETFRYSAAFWTQQGVNLWNMLSRSVVPLVNRFDPARAAHIFRNAPGHANPADAAARAQWINIFEQVASNPGFHRPDALRAGIITQQAANAGVQAYTWTASTGQQIWVTARGGTIQNAGVNLPGWYR